MTRRFDVAVVGVSGLVGAAMLDLLHEREFPVGKVFPLDVAAAAGGVASFGRRELPVGDVAQFDFSQVQLALFSAGAAVAAEYAPKAAVEGCVVIDNSTQFRLDPEVPLVVPEVNPQDLAKHDVRGIVATPTCTVTLLALVLKPLLDAAGIERVNVATYQAVSGSGAEALEELGRQTADLLNFKPIEPKAYPRQIAFNVMAQIDAVEADGQTREELRLVQETARLLGDAVRVNATAVRVPVFYGHSAAVHLETREPLSVAQARELLGKAPGLELLDEPSIEGFPTPVTEASGQDAVFVGRLRRDPTHPRGLNLWLTGDNIRKGGALNAVQIAELLSRDYL
ncbi:aspartate-semialdehyde dehydrogenase [Solimonas sp. K1W22B-7]|uniref:aspartate-semialdehyde dehydrogenase n=1 Tax=Solimonas sp. K1W22B-7 TaxID=2303331 RepID=UPI000E3303E6|nr:aspartate-semialdehyde dehydrogenase [Solimonas sp. K1W22B-7]AXQ29468.1 aspartate-semialdehyde dehydrogenase [Solimonas sp. K1W22B-7]